MDRHEELEIGEITERELDIGGIEGRRGVGHGSVGLGGRGFVAIQFGPSVDVERGIGRIGRFLGECSHGRVARGIAQRGNVPDARSCERDQDRIPGRVVAGLRDQLDPYARSSRGARDLSRQAIRSRFIDRSAQSKSPDDDDHTRSLPCAARCGRHLTLPLRTKTARCHWGCKVSTSTIGSRHPGRARALESQALGYLRDRRRPARTSVSSRGQSLVEFTLILPVMLIILLVVADFGRLFAAGITVESAARNAAELAAARYNQALIEPSIDYAEIHRLAWSSVCTEASGLPNATPGGGGECNGLPTRVCVHDAADSNCGAVYNGASGTAGCAAVSSGMSNSMTGGIIQKYVEVRVCYRFNTIFSMTLPSIGGPLEALGGDFYLESSRVFAVADY